MIKDDKDESRYDDIIDMPRHVSTYKKQMPIADRAAQFSPFAALTGFEGAISETARLTDEKIELTEIARVGLDEKLQIIQEIGGQKQVDIEYFVADEHKEGGHYEVASGVVVKINTYDRLVVMDDGSRLPIDDIIDIRGDFLRLLEE